MTDCTWEVIEDNAGQIYLAVFDAGECIYWGARSDPNDLAIDLKALRRGAHPLRYLWEEPFEAPDDYDPEADYNQFTADEYGWELIADDKDVYPDRMGEAGLIAFQIICRDYAIYPFRPAPGTIGTTIFDTDSDTVIIGAGGYHWSWDTRNGSGTDFVPDVGAAKYFERSNRLDIAECIHTGYACIFGKRHRFR